MVRLIRLIVSCPIAKVVTPLAIPATAATKPDSVNLDNADSGCTVVLGVNWLTVITAKAEMIPVAPAAKSCLVLSDVLSSRANTLCLGLDRDSICWL